MRHHRAAIVTLVCAGTLDAVSGLLFGAIEHCGSLLGIYWAVTTATTVGYGDVTPHTTAGHVIAIVVMLTVVPLFAATFSLFTSALTSVHIQPLHRKIDRLSDDRSHAP